jgi:sortase A
MVDTVEEASPEPASAPHKTWGDWVRFALRGIGQVLITAGVVVLLFVVYEVYVTNYFAHAAQSKVKHELLKEFVERKDPLRGTGDGKLTLPGSKTPTVPEGTGIAFLYIPRLGQDYAWAIVQGTDDADLEKGPGHYIGSALPGQVGNFAVAGHRVGKGEPFLNLDHLQAGDAVIVQTESKWFVYRVLGDDGNIDAPDPAVQNIPGREIVSPADGTVLYPVPDHSPALTPTERLMTMTTCHPKFTASHRMVLHAVLAKTYPASGVTMPSPVKNLYSSQES